MIIASENNQPVPHLDFSNHANSGLVALGGLLGLAAIGGGGRRLHVAIPGRLSTARALGYAAKHSPGWGVGCWFVPVVALWMPYQALRDCLPPDDPNRKLVRTFWAFFIGQAVFAVAAAAAAFFSTLLSLGLRGARERCSASGCCPPLPVSSPPSPRPTGTPSVVRPENPRVGLNRRKATG